MHLERSSTRCAAALLLGCVSALACAAGDPAEGKEVFESECSICHAVEAGKTKVGPSLAGIVGRKAGSLEGYVYSEVLKGSGITWSEQELDNWITNPQKKLPGSKMTYAGEDHADERAAVIAYLETLK